MKYYEGYDSEYSPVYYITLNPNNDPELVRWYAPRSVGLVSEVEEWVWQRNLPVGYYGNSVEIRFYEKNMALEFKLRFG